MNWTNSQIDAKDTLQIWLDSEIVIQSDHFRCLEGPAGSGKSTVVQAIIEHIPKNKILGAAPTHTAKDILIEFTGIQAVTNHQLLGLKPDVALEYYNPASPVYAQLNPDHFERGGLELIVIDEGSMLNKAIVKMIMERAIETGKKVLFIGDRLQLPPIGELISDVFTMVEIVSLTEIVRQAGSNPANEMIAMARADAKDGTDYLKDYIFNTGHNNPVCIEHSESGIEEGYIVSADGNILKDKLYALFSSTVAEHDYKHVKIVSFLNAKAKAYNKKIKQVVNPNELPVSTGDWLLGYAPFKVKQKPLTQNGLYYKVLSATLAFHTFNADTYSIIKTTLRYKITLENGTQKEIDMTLKLLHPDSYPVFYPLLVKAWQAGTSRKRWRDYYQLLEQFALIDDFDIDGYDQHNRPKKYSLAKKNMDLGYAITVHKSQGCTFNNVYIDYTSFDKCFEPSTRRSLSYVAFSRTRNINLVHG